MAQGWDARPDWPDYTPYELRAVGAFVRLGQRDRALAALDYFFGDMRPVAWNGWAEVVGRHEREPRFIGDMPHAWISSDYIRSALDLFVHERDRDHALVLAAGNLMQTDLLIAGVVVLSLLGLIVAGLLGLIEKRLLRWR